MADRGGGNGGEAKQQKEENAANFGRCLRCHLDQSGRNLTKSRRSIETIVAALGNNFNVVGSLFFGHSEGS